MITLRKWVGLQVVQAISMVQLVQDIIMQLCTLLGPGITQIKTRIALFPHSLINTTQMKPLKIRGILL